MDSIPAAALPLLLHLAPAFTKPTFRRAIVLHFAALLTLGRRTVHNLLRTAREGGSRAGRTRCFVLGGQLCSA
jgi:hypothetical protein